jgi:hypothetical protein
MSYTVAAEKMMSFFTTFLPTDAGHVQHVLEHDMHMVSHVFVFKRRNKTHRIKGHFQLRLVVELPFVLATIYRAVYLVFVSVRCYF